MTSNTVIIGNLKMHASKGILEQYGDMVKDHEFGLLVPYPYLTMAQDLFEESQVWVGAQSISEHDKGAYSSQVSAGMLKDIGIDTVMIGHQEVRALGVDVASQIQRAKECGLKVVYCVGESDRKSSQSVLEEQLSVLDSDLNVTIAYEPIWSIGTGKVAEYNDINEAIQVIRGWLEVNMTGNLGSIQVLYGGSIHNKNCEAVLSHTNVDGFLVGGAALEPKLMLEVIERCR